MLDSLGGLERGAQIGRYTVLSLLGRGGMGVVYEAYDPELDRRVALKLLHRTGDGSRASQARNELLGEAKTLARLSHPNVVAVHDAGRVEQGSVSGAVYLAMELVEGTTLREWVQGKRDDGAHWPTILSAYIEAGRGLAAAHRAGIIHRDFKPQNVLVSEDGERLRVRVADFGLAVLEPTRGGDSSPEASYERLPKVAGTPAYMAPEQIALEEVGPAADQFSFCVSLFEALFGVHPFKRDTIIEQADAVLHADPSLPGKGPRVPPWLRRALLTGLSRKPVDRHASMDALVAILAHDRWQRLRRLLLGAAGITVVAGIGYGVAALFEPGTVRVTVVDEAGNPLPNAVVRIGGESLASGPDGHAGELAAGTYRLDVTADDYETHSTAIDLARGGERTMTIALAHEQGRIGLEVQPRGATVLVDGVDHGSRLVDLSLDTGQHEIVARKVGHYERRMTVDIEQGEKTEAFLSLPTAVRYEYRNTGPDYELLWAGDATGDGRPEVYTRTFGRMSLIDPWNAETLWTLSTPGVYSVLFRFADFDGDGADDLLRVRDGLEGWVEVFPAVRKNDDEPLWFRKWEVDDGDSNVVPTEAATPDVDGDGRADVVTALRWDRQVVARSGRDGRVLWRQALDAPAFALEAIGEGGVLVLTNRSALRLDRDGALVWSSALPQGIVLEDDARRRYALTRARTALVTTRDLDRDGTMDAIVPVRGHRDGGTWAINGKTGATMWYAEHLHTAPVSSTPGDLDGDGADELLLQHAGNEPETHLVDARSGNVRARMPGANAIVLEGYDPPRILAILDGDVVTYAVDGTQIGRSPAPSPTKAPPIPFDHDGDGTMEAMVADGAPGVRVFDGMARDVGLVVTDAPVTSMLSEGDADHDGYADLLVRSAGLLRLTAVQTVWSRTSRTGLRTAPLALDADGNGSIEIAAYGDFEHEQALHVLDGATGRVLATSDRSKVIRTPTVAELSGQAVVLAQSEQREFRASSFVDASPLVSLPVEVSYASPGVGDADGDGKTDVLLIPWSGGRIQMLELESTRELWGLQTEIGSFATPSIENLDGTAPAVVLIGLNDGGLELRDGASGTLRWRLELGPNKFAFVPIVGYDGATARLFVSSPSDGTFLALDPRTGETLWRNDGSTPSSGAATADVDGDGRPEVFAGTPTGLVSYSWDGEVRWHHRTSTDRHATYVSATGHVVTADLDHDGRLEVLSSFADGSVRVLDADTGVLLVRFSGSGEGMEASPTPADVDGDGLDELLVAGHDRWLHCLRLPPAAFSNRGAAAPETRTPAP